MVGVPSPTTTSIPGDSPLDECADLAVSPTGSSRVPVWATRDVDAVEAGLIVLAGWRERVALRAAAEPAGRGAASVDDGLDVVAAASELAAGWTSEARSMAPVVASERVRVLAGLAEAVAAAQAVLVSVVEGSAQHAVEGAPSPVAWLTSETGVSAGAAKRTVAVGRLVERFDATRSAVESGVVSIPKAELLAMAVLAKGRDQIYERDEAVLVEAARTLPTAELSKVVRRWVDLADDDLDTGEPEAALARRGVSFARLASGNLRIDGELDPVGATYLEAAWAAFDRPDPIDDETCPPRTVAQRRADLLTALAARALSEANGTARGPVATVDVIVDLERLAAAVPALVAGPQHDHDHHDDHHQDERGGDERVDDACSAGGTGHRCDAGNDPDHHADPQLDGAPTEPPPVDRPTTDPSTIDPADGPPAGHPPPVDLPPIDPATAPLASRPPRGDLSEVDPPLVDPPAGHPPPGAGDAPPGERSGDEDLPTRPPDQSSTAPTLGALLAAVRADPRGWCDAIGVGPIPSHVLAQVTCDCWIGRNVMAGPSATLDLGRRRRTFTADQRRAIIARDRHCTHPRCTRGPEWCEVHHLDDWDHDGPTDITNGTLRCTWHHTWHHLQQRQRLLRRTIADAAR